MSDIQRAGTTPRYSDFTVHQGVVYCVEVPPDENADIATQTAQMLASLEALLARAGSGKGRLCAPDVDAHVHGVDGAPGLGQSQGLPQGGGAAQARTGRSVFRMAHPRCTAPTRWAASAT